MTMASEQDGTVRFLDALRAAEEAAAEVLDQVTAGAAKTTARGWASQESKRRTDVLATWLGDATCGKSKPASSRSNTGARPSSLPSARIM